MTVQNARHAQLRRRSSSAQPRHAGTALTRGDGDEQELQAELEEELRAAGQLTAAAEPQHPWLVSLAPQGAAPKRRRT